ncbi:hypothetical protein [Flavobacterium taihuense]|uniref:Capsule polysaccharide biosynthesis protein n=1 Tax=Flavobacterium taihuense TaxID=2857508 RepID=A0ABS6XUR6_9FLAO|nr:hypothetical protein [Flavobacterium taihuense]MBW4360339.1 hypothetical protein [Flavobacterium taihuense]
MEFKERENLINFLENTEQKYPVEDWKVEDVEIWPIIKTTIFFSTYNQGKIESKNLKSKIISFFRLFKLDVVYSYFCLKRAKIMEIKYMFSGFFGHRVMWDGVFYNRYFDPIMDSIEDNEGQRSSIFEYDKKRKIKHYREDRVFDVTKFIHYFNFITKGTIVDYDKFQGFDGLLKELEQGMQINPTKLLTKISSELNNAFVWKKLWLYVLDRNKASHVFVLCYYNSKMYGLLLAAKEKGLVSVDMQHGGQGGFHVAYNFKKIPLKGYKLVPDYFWNWDKNSADNILKFTRETPHKVIVGGNPWIDFLKNQKVFLVEKEIIIYTLQTTLVPVLHDYIIEAIKKTPQNFSWWLRLHPRMTENEITELYNTLTKENIIDKVEIKKASKIPLPLILANCVVHVSHFSGSILEANLMNVKANIILGEIGKKYFQDILNIGGALYYDVSDKMDLYQFIENCIEDSKNKKENVVDEVNYKSAIQLLH